MKIIAVTKGNYKSHNTHFSYLVEISHEDLVKLSGQRPVGDYGGFEVGTELEVAKIWDQLRKIKNLQNELGCYAALVKEFGEAIIYKNPLREPEAK